MEISRTFVLHMTVTVSEGRNEHLIYSDYFYQIILQKSSAKTLHDQLNMELPLSSISLLMLGIIEKNKLHPPILFYCHLKLWALITYFLNAHSYI